MINHSKITLANADSDQYDFAYSVKKEAQGQYIREIWGWDEEKQLWFFDHDWQKNRPTIISYAGRPIGTIVVLNENATIEIQNFFILAEYQNKGMGTFLLQRFLEDGDAKHKTAKITYLKSSPVGSLYRRFGFRVVDQSETHCHMIRHPL